MVRLKERMTAKPLPKVAVAMMLRLIRKLREVRMLAKAMVSSLSQASACLMQTVRVGAAQAVRGARPPLALLS